MFDFEVKKPAELKICIYGQTYSIKKPTVKFSEDMQKKLKSAEGSGGELQAVKEVVGSLGIPSAVIDEMTTDDFLSMTNHIFGVKKS
jgi:hypothetical protein